MASCVIVIHFFVGILRCLLAASLLVFMGGGEESEVIIRRWEISEGK